MPQPYSDSATFLSWLPTRYVAEITDDVAGETPDEAKIATAMEWASGFFHSHVRVRSDIPIPVLNEDGTVEPEVKELIHDLTLFRLFSRRGHVPEQVQMQFTMHRDWLRDIANRRANLNIEKADGKNKVDTNDQPVIDGTAQNKFEDFQF